jgi:3-methyladenine DNA glycosylase AlkD
MIASMHNSNWLLDEIENSRDATYAEWCKQYMRNQFEFIGVKVPILRALTKKWVKNIDKPDRILVREIVLFFWQLKEREYQRVALELLITWRKQLTLDDVSWIAQLITTKSWWDTVDTIAPHIIGYLYHEFPIEMSNVLECWNRGDNLWLQRTTILFQLSARSCTNEELLYRYIKNLSNSEEFFVQKAIGWALRHYAKVNPESVRAFIIRCILKPLSRREAVKHLV